MRIRGGTAIRTVRSDRATPRISRSGHGDFLEQGGSLGEARLGVGRTASADHQTWTGKIRDSMCGAKHNAAAEHAGKNMSDRDCTLACVKGHQAKYVFVSGGKVYNLENQDFAALQEHAGHTVQLTGDMNGDTIVVSKVVMRAK